MWAGTGCHTKESKSLVGNFSGDLQGKWGHNSTSYALSIAVLSNVVWVEIEDSTLHDCEDRPVEGWYDDNPSPTSPDIGARDSAFTWSTSKSPGLSPKSQVMTSFPAIDGDAQVYANESESQVVDSQFFKSQIPECNFSSLSASVPQLSPLIIVHSLPTSTSQSVVDHHIDQPFHTQPMSDSKSVYHCGSSDISSHYVDPFTMSLDLFLLPHYNFLTGPLRRTDPDNGAVEY
ncbi:hypothetical protein BKA83DRAFT_4127952 [Pisolithus microcarpus]|nr:hypothetical protein BKA83DRAFT_4127952 [Pisolithus microcarpus]